MEGKLIKNDNFHPIIQFRKGQTLLTQSARLSLISIYIYSTVVASRNHLSTGITVTVVGLFPA